MKEQKGREISVVYALCFIFEDNKKGGGRDEVHFNAHVPASPSV